MKEVEELFVLWTRFLDKNTQIVPLSYTFTCHWNCQIINLLSHPLQLVRWWCCMVCKVRGRSLSPSQSPETLKIKIGESGSQSSPSHLFCSQRMLSFTTTITTSATSPLLCKLAVILIHSSSILLLSSSSTISLQPLAGPGGFGKVGHTETW